MPSAYEGTDIIMSEANNKVPGHPLKIFDFVSGSGSYIIFSRSGNISYGNAVYHIAKGDISLKSRRLGISSRVSVYTPAH